MSNLSPTINEDINAIGNIPVIANILDVVCRTTGMGFAAVARVTPDRWVACAVLDQINFGLKPGGELVVESTICHEIMETGKAVVIDHVAEDPAFCGHPALAKYGFQSYISIPIYRRDGSFFGTLCAIDPKPARLNNPQIIEMFNLFADLISFHLSALEQVARAELELAEERRISEIREQFIAILGHDLRNPLGAISNSAQMMLRMPLNDMHAKLANIIKHSSYRMNGLIENVLDFARGRLGEGIILETDRHENIGEILKEVISELLVVWPQRVVHLQADLNVQVHCDSRRIAQLFSNLLGNALIHGDKESPVQVRAESQVGKFTLSVTNKGDMIPESMQEHLFQPFSRGKVSQDKQGLGLGLYIASEIAIAHKGSLLVSSDEEETCFTLCLDNR